MRFPAPTWLELEVTVRSAPDLLRHAFGFREMDTGAGDAVQDHIARSKC